MKASSKRSRARMVDRWLDVQGFGGGRAGSGPSLDSTLTTVFRRLDLDLVLDVGANRGQYAAFVRDRCDWRGPLWSFEPVASTFAALSEVMDGDPEWRGFNLALGRKAEELEMHRYGESAFDSLLAASDSGRAEFAYLTQERRELVRVERLDAVVDAGAGARVHLKLDTQGSDLAVLEGAAGMLDRVQSLQIELAVTAIYEGAPMFRDALVHVLDLGFEPLAFFAITAADGSPRAIEFDAVFVRPE